MRAHYGLPQWSSEDIKRALNKPGHNLIKDQIGVEKEKEARAYYMCCYLKNNKHLKLKESAIEVLEYDHSLGFINILTSNKTENILLDEVKNLGVLSCFDKIVGSKKTPEDKPSKVFADKVLAEFPNKELIVSIGDSLSDIKMAHHYPNGIAILVFTNPNRREFENEKPNYHAIDLASCKSILKKLNQRPNTLAHYKKQQRE